jgi:hypothetical protein
MQLYAFELICFLAYCCPSPIGQIFDDGDTRGWRAPFGSTFGL